jgi:hypothetical protein
LGVWQRRGRRGKSQHPLEIRSLQTDNKDILSNCPMKIDIGKIKATPCALAIITSKRLGNNQERRVDRSKSHSLDIHHTRASKTKTNLEQKTENHQSHSLAERIQTWSKMGCGAAAAMVRLFKAKVLLSPHLYTVYSAHLCPGTRARACVCTLKSESNQDNKSAL